MSVRRILALLALVVAGLLACAAAGAAGGNDVSPSEGVAVGDSATVVGGAVVGDAEGVAVADSAGRLTGAIASDAEGVAVGDSAGRLTGAIANDAEGVAVGDSAGQLSGAIANDAEGVGVSDGSASQILNTPPVADAGPDLTGVEGTAVAGSGSFTDPDSNQSWTATVDYGDGGGPQPLTLDANKTFQLGHTYDDNGTYGITVVVTDAANASSSDTVAVTVDNASPTATIGNNGPIDEGASATVTLSNPLDPSKADTNAGLHYAFACDGGSLAASSYATAGTTGSTSCAFDDSGLHTVRARIYDKDGGFTEYTTGVDVRNVAPTALVANNGPVSEGSPATITFSGQHDPSTADTNAGFTYRYACDGISLGGPTPAASTTCTFDDGPSDHTVLARIADKDGGYTDYTTVVHVTNVAPDGALGNSGPANEGSPVTIAWSGQSDPSRADTTAGFTYRYACDNQNLGAPTTSASTTCTFDDGPSTHTVLSRITDKDGGSTDRTTTVTVNNVAPTAALVAPTTPTNEGSPFTLALQNGADPSTADTAAGFKLEYDCGNGAGYQSSATCTAIDNPSQAVKARITDKDGGATEYAATVPVANVAPSVTITGPPSGSLYQIGQPVTFTGAFTDPGVKDTHTAQWSFDSISAAGAVSEANGSGTTSLVTSFAAAGVYSVRLTVTDKDGAATTASTVSGLDALVVVYDPSAGFVTGGGWIDSPAGAYRPSPQLTGKATFGFVSKYQKGANVPTGNTEFHFNAANLNFQSTTYQWLVVAGSKAQYKGAGTLNGTGGYGFMLTAWDGSPDRLRLKVWDAGGTIVYDNALGSSDDIDTANPEALGGGSIIVHR